MEKTWLTEPDVVENSGERLVLQPWSGICQEACL